MIISAFFQYIISIHMYDMFCNSPVSTAKVAIARPKGQLSRFNHPPNIFHLFLLCPPSTDRKIIFLTQIFPSFSHSITLLILFHQILPLLFSGPNICPLQVLCSARSLSRTIKDPFTDVSTVHCPAHLVVFVGNRF